LGVERPDRLAHSRLDGSAAGASERHQGIPLTVAQAPGMQVLGGELP
jgi:hypothetical protein